MTTGQPISARDFLPPVLSIPSLQRAARRCRGCDLYKRATQTVFGEGPEDARIIMVGEQPGDAEDRQGRPFVGNAGKLLDRALKDAGLDRSEIYLTNAVKHFKWEERGKRRIHKKPRQSEIDACRPWIDDELAIVKPKALVCLGSTAAQALLGRQFKVTRSRGTLVPSPLAPAVLATVHPSSILRAPDEETRHAEFERFVADLKVAAKHLRG